MRTCVQDFYKKVDPQLVLNGVHASIMACLKSKASRSPKIDISCARRRRRRTTCASCSTRSATRSRTYGQQGFGPTKITYAAISGVIGSVKDKYTVFLDPKAFAELNEGLDGTSFGGVGLTYSIDDQTKNIRVENVIIDGPSDGPGFAPTTRSARSTAGR